MLYIYNMMMKQIEVDISPKQTSRLRNGHPVRVKPGMNGGTVLFVSPNTFNMATRSFNKNKGLQIQLSPEEIQANRDGIDEMNGMGIFKTIGRVAKKVAPVARKVGKVIVPVAKRLAISAVKAGGKEVAKQLPNLASSGLVAGATLLGQPELIPVAGIVGSKLGGLAGKQLNKSVDKIGRGMHMDGMGLYAGGGKRGMGLFAGRGMDMNMNGMGMCGMGRLGSTSNMSRLVPNRQTAGLVGISGNLLGPGHPALQSQAMNANFQFQHTMPVQFQMR